MRCLPCFFFLASLTLTFFPWLHAETAQIEKRRTYIVHMDTSFMPKAFTTHDNWYFSTVDSLNSANFDGHPSSTASLIYTYNHALDGFSAFLSVDEVKALKKTPGFISAYRDKTVKLDSTHTPEFLSLNPSMDLWPDSNFGEDVIVGVLDSGI
ncbi:hypothetical protein FH972_018073 [Carpinus fangiana]|uniref:Inhibitor I9 domain-containing protein n=1 Tax=Carpinus fangiana TaxID=176857 RepID=A0A5N6RLC4_9ROSI|nr:hypothetical protein FH972_018073 [Carpinus fangiana]